MPGRAGTLQALAAVSGLLPMSAAIGVLSGRFGLTAVLIAVHVIALAATAALATRRA